jgi:uncharacterized RDD family membrane protein YckC
MRGHGHAGFWRRLAAFLIDSLLLNAVGFTLALLVEMVAPNDLLAQANILPVDLMIAWAYYALLESSPAQATVGKMALEIYVTDRRGDPIDFRHASIRWWAKLLSTLVLMIGWLMVAFTPQKRGLHDMVAGTLVLKRAAEPVKPAGSQAMAVPERWDGNRWVPGQSLIADERRR